MPEDPIEGARRGLDLAKALREAGARYFERNPAAADMLTTIEKAGPTYVVHEYLNAQWLPMYFAQVAAEMAASDLFFVGQLPLHLNFRDLCIPAPAQPFFAALGDRLAYEGLKDFALNTFFRQDVFVKGAPGRSDATSRAWLMETPFGMSGDEPPWTGESQLPNHLLRFRGPIFDALVPAMREGAQTIPTLLARPELKGVPEERVREALLHMLIGGAITAFVEPTESRATPRPRVASAYNRHVLTRAMSSDVPAVLASSALGNGVRLTKPELVALAALTGDLPAPDLGVSISARLAKLAELGVVT